MNVGLMAALLRSMQVARHKHSTRLRACPSDNWENTRLGRALTWLLLSRRRTGQNNCQGLTGRQDPGITGQPEV